MPVRSTSSAQSAAYCRAAVLRGAKAATGARSTDIRSISDSAGITVTATSDRSAGRRSAISRCRRLRRSIMEQNASRVGRCPSKPEMNPDS